jgi:hypothetical protein
MNQCRNCFSWVDLHSDSDKGDRMGICGYENVLLPEWAKSATNTGRRHIRGDDGTSCGTFKVKP